MPVELIPAADIRAFRDTCVEPISYIETWLWIRDKDERVIPFHLNHAQRHVIEIKRRAIASGEKPRFLILKARREGVTTFEQAISFWRVATQTDATVATLAHESESTEMIFRIANLFYDRIDPRWRPRRLAPTNKRNLNFPDLNSLFYIGTAGKRAFARGDTLGRVHGSEVAFWPGTEDEQEVLMAGITEATSHGEIVLETTANGRSGMFYHLWQDASKGKNEWTPIFLPWWLDPGNHLDVPEGEAEAIRDSLNDEEGMLIERYALDLGHIAWRRDKRKSASLKRLFPQEYAEEPETAFIVMASSYFDTHLAAECIKRVPKPLERNPSTGLVVWQRPEHGKKYVVGADTAEGVPGGDLSVGAVIDVTTMQQCAKIVGLWRPEDFAERLAKLATHYNRAVLAIEKNNHGHSCLNTLGNTLGYPNLYYHRDYDDRGKIIQRLGFPTTSKTRPIMLSGLRAAFEDRQMEMRDRDLLNEFFTFVLQPGGQYAAGDADDDDHVMAWAVALMVRSTLASGPVKVGPSTTVPAGRRMFSSTGARRLFQSPGSGIDIGKGRR